MNINIKSAAEGGVIAMSLLLHIFNCIFTRRNKTTSEIVSGELFIIMLLRMSQVIYNTTHALYVLRHC